MPLGDGIYTITNVRYLNLAVLPDANDDSDVVAGIEKNNPGEKWNITLESNKKYTIKNHGFANSASCKTRAKAGESVHGRPRDKLWEIREREVTGRYTISPTDSDVFWGLADGEVDTPVTLSSVPNDTKNQWIFTPISVGRIDDGTAKKAAEYPPPPKDALEKGEDGGDGGDGGDCGGGDWEDGGYGHVEGDGGDGCGGGDRGDGGDGCGGGDRGDGGDGGDGGHGGYFGGD